MDLKNISVAEANVLLNAVELNCDIAADSVAEDLYVTESTFKTKTRINDEPFVSLKEVAEVLSGMRELTNDRVDCLVNSLSLRAKIEASLKT